MARTHDLCHSLFLPALAEQDPSLGGVGDDVAPGSLASVDSGEQSVGAGIRLDMIRLQACQSVGA